MKVPASPSHQAVATLCPACGLCCNGVLFGDVELQSRDDAKRLTSLGVKVFPKGRKSAFAQPCDCLVNGLCRIYSDRPKRCAAFDCGLLKRVQRTELSPDDALKKIAVAKRQAEAVRRLVRQLGNTNEALPLNQRYAEVIAQPIDMSASKAVNQRSSELLMAVAKLAESLEQDFLS